MYGFTAPDFFRIDDLLDFSNDQIISSATTTTDSDHRHPHNNFSQYPNNSSSTSSVADTLMEPQFHCSNSTDFTSVLCVPNDDVAELEWLSNFVDDSNTYFPANEFTGTANFLSDAPFHGRSRSKRSKAPSKNNSRTSLPESHMPIIAKCYNREQEENQNSPVSSARTSQSETRRCSHCASEKTPQWRTGPLGPKTLCNACGVRFKSGRLVPEYRPAASPTFVLTKHSNSHRKVMELRRQKEEQQQIRQHRNFEVC